MNKELLRTALKYIEKGYSYEDLSWGDDLYDASDDDKETCLSYYEMIQEEGAKWARKKLGDEQT